MLFHLLTSPRLLADVLAELATVATSASGALDTGALMSLPLLQAVYAETLRLYVASNISREVKADFAMDNGFVLRAGHIVMAPTFLGHRDEAWEEAAAAAGVGRGDEEGHAAAAAAGVGDFEPERFLHREGGGGEKKKVVFSSAGLVGRYFPYGGGAHICPGRVLAKEIILSAVAVLLLTFEFEFVGWVEEGGDGGGRELARDVFPQRKESCVGIGVLHADRDMKVNIRRRTR